MQLMFELNIADNVDFLAETGSNLARAHISKQGENWYFNVLLAKGRKAEDVVPVLKELGAALMQNDWVVIDSNPPTNARN